MTKQAAIKKMEQIESLIAELKKAGCDVYSVDNDKLVMDYGATKKYNAKAHENAVADERGGDAYYKPHFAPKTKHDYLIYIA